MDLVLVQQENIARAPAGLGWEPGWSLGIAPSANPRPNPQGAPEFGGVGTTDTTEATASEIQPQGLLAKLVLEVSRRLQWYHRTRATLVTACEECKAGDKCPKVTKVAAGE